MTAKKEMYSPNVRKFVFSNPENFARDPES